MEPQEASQRANNLELGKSSEFLRGSVIIHLWKVSHCCELKRELENGKDPSPTHYDQKGYFSPANQKQSFTFGESRSRMKKIHLQVIEKMANEKLPGPGLYKPAKTFGQEGPHFSMRTNTDLVLEKCNNTHLWASYR